MPEKTLKELLLEQYGCAIAAIYGDLADKPFVEVKIEREDLDAIANKVAWYLDK